MLPLSVILAHWKDNTPKRCKFLLSLSNSWSEIKNISFTELQKAHWPDNTIHSFIEWRKNTQPEIIQNSLEKESILAYTPNDTSYPRLLQTLPDKPLVIFVRGTLKETDHSLAVVGTRACTTYGYSALEKVLSGIDNNSLSIVSGLALGIDGRAHELAISKNLYTIAVLGSGVDNTSLYPKAHVGLARRILESGGAIISEYPPGFKPTAYSFPARNRIIAGLAEATLVIEGTAESGSLLTAKAALEYGRDVAAIPHPITTTTGTGPNTLIRDGAACIRTSEDIQTLLSIPTITKKQTKDTSSLNQTEQRVFSLLLEKGALHIDTIAELLELPSSATLEALTMLEIQQFVKNHGMMEFSTLN